MQIEVRAADSCRGKNTSQHLRQMHGLMPRPADTTPRPRLRRAVLPPGPPPGPKGSSGSVCTAGSTIPAERARPSRSMLSPRELTCRTCRQTSQKLVEGWQNHYRLRSLPRRLPAPPAETARAPGFSAVGAGTDAAGGRCAGLMVVSCPRARPIRRAVRHRRLVPLQHRQSRPAYRRQPALPRLPSRKPAPPVAAVRTTSWRWRRRPGAACAATSRTWLHPPERDDASSAATAKGTSVHTDGPDGKMADFEVKCVRHRSHAAVPDQRPTVAAATADDRGGTRRPEKRWFHLCRTKAPPGVMHWTGRYQTANTMCIACPHHRLREARYGTRPTASTRGLDRGQRGVASRATGLAQHAWSGPTQRPRHGGGTLAWRWTSTRRAQKGEVEVCAACPRRNRTHAPTARTGNRCSVTRCPRG